MPQGGLTNRQGGPPSLAAMASIPPEPILPAPATRPAPAPSPAAVIALWETLHARTEALAAQAQIGVESARAPIERLVEDARTWQLALAAQGLEDIEAMLAPGLAALATLTARGQDTAAPALALWREFHAAREGVLAALGPVEVA